MSELSTGSIAQQFAAASALELAAVALGLAYVVLAIRQHRGCWLAGGLSTALYVLVFMEARLYLQSALQLLYVALAVAGWRAWSRAPAAPGGLEIRRWSGRRHLAAGAVALAATALTAPALAAWSDSAAPWADALGTWASVVATWLMIRKLAASWLWWIAIDLGLAWLFASQGLGFTALLYVGFAGLAVAGWWNWRRAPVVVAGNA